MLCGKKQGDPPNLENLEYYEVKLGGANDRGVTFTDRTGTTLAQARNTYIHYICLSVQNIYIYIYIIMYSKSGNR